MKIYKGFFEEWSLKFDLKNEESKLDIEIGINWVILVIFIIF